MKVKYYKGNQGEYITPCPNGCDIMVASSECKKCEYFYCLNLMLL